MEANKFYALIRAVELGSLTKAADELGYTQAGLTHMMNRLEKELGVEILRRTKTGVSLTSDGETILPYIKQFINSSTELEKAINNISQSDRKSIRVGTFPSIASRRLPKIINDFRLSNPNVEVEPCIAAKSELLTMLKDGELDVAFMTEPEKSGIEWKYICDDEIFKILPPNCEWNADKIYVPMYEIDEEICDSVCQNSIQLDTTTLFSMVSNGLGCGIATKLMLEDVHSNVIVQPFEPAKFRKLGIAVNSRSEMPVLVKKFAGFEGKIW